MDLRAILLASADEPRCILVRTGELEESVDRSNKWTKAWIMFIWKHEVIDMNNYVLAWCIDMYVKINAYVISMKVSSM